MVGRIPSQLKPKVEKKCVNCGNKFISSYSFRKHCSVSCRDTFNSYKKNPNKDRKHKYKKYYGISLEEYNNLFDKQNGCCAICGEHQINFKKRLAVDHNHSTGEIRGLLCHNCNLGIGRLKNNYDLLIKASEYVK